MSKRIYITLAVFGMASLFHVEAKENLSSKDELYERLDTSSLSDRESLQRELSTLVEKADLQADLESYISQRNDSPGYGLAMDLLLSSQEKNEGAFGLLTLVVKSSEPIQNAALDLFLRRFDEQKYPGLSLQSQPTSFRHKLTLKMLERTGEKPELASKVESFLEKQISPENAQLFILPLDTKNPGFKTGLSVLVNTLSAANRIGELTDLLFDTRSDFRSAAFEAMFKTLNNQKVFLSNMQKSNVVQKKRLVGRLLDFAEQDSTKELATVIAAIDLDKDTEIVLRDYARTKAGAMTAASAIVQLYVLQAKDLQKEVTKLLKDENPYVRKIAEEYSRQSALPFEQTALK